MRTKTMLFIVTVLAACLWATSISDLAGRMQAGEWRELFTTNMGPTVQSNSGGATGYIFPYAQNGVWDPGTESFYFIGSDHQHETGYAKFIRFSVQTNTWGEMARPPYFGALTATAMHGYDHNGIDPVRGIIYFTKFCCPATFWKYDIKGAAWSQMPSAPLAYAYQTEGGLEYFPELDGLVFAEGGAVYFFDNATQKWSTPATGLTMGDYHNFAEYNPVHHVVVFGGGNGSTALYKLDAQKHVTALSNAPSAVGPLRVNWNIFTSDPVSGDYLAFGGPIGSGAFYKYDVVSDTWTRINQTVPFFMPQSDANGGVVLGTVAAPVSSLGVVLFAKAQGGGHAYLYKHSAATSNTQRDGATAGGTGLCVSPNPFRTGVKVKFSGPVRPETAHMRVYSLDGRLVMAKNFPAAALQRGIRFDGANLSCGVYFFTLDTGSKVVTERVLMIK